MAGGLGYQTQKGALGELHVHGSGDLARWTLVRTEDGRPSMRCAGAGGVLISEAANSEQSLEGCGGRGEEGRDQGSASPGWAEQMWLVFAKGSRKCSPDTELGWVAVKAPSPTTLVQGRAGRRAGAGPQHLAQGPQRKLWETETGPG